MKQYRNLYLALTLLTVGNLCCTSCEDALNENPDSYYTRKDFFTNAANAQMAITGIYSTLAGIYADKDGQALSTSDDACYVKGGAGTGQDNSRGDISHYKLTPLNTWTESVWNGKYSQLNRANYCIQNIETMKGYSGSEKLHKLVAEAKFLRAQAALDLVRYWGDVPFKTTYSAQIENAYQPRTDREVIYDQIIKDLNNAKEVLPWATASSSPETATQGAARALLMRALLARASYSRQMDGTLKRPDETLRKEYFEAVIDEWEAFVENGYHGFYEGGYEALFRSFSEGFLNSKESLFEVAYNYPDANGYWGSYIGPAVSAPNLPVGEASKYMGRSNAMFRVVPEWRDFYETETVTVEENGKQTEKVNPKDKRRDVAICTYSYSWNDEKVQHVKKDDTSGKNWYPGKWRREWMPAGTTKDLNATDINYCLLRYADVVLMAAEAYNEIGETRQAWTLLNKVRTRAEATEAWSLAEYRKVQPKLYDLPFFNSGSADDDFRTALYWERGLELSFEGQRKWDLIRWGVMAQALKLFCDKSLVNSGTTKVYIAGDMFRSGKHELLPIPLNEIQSNHKLNGLNNPGY